ncbi:unnamed protein product [Amoebophrya sp. A120]|nr:unnamed protein product [Amoebophrya sp. A120]|eukprot:GSA120T00020329001.1
MQLAALVLRESATCDCTSIRQPKKAHLEIASLRAGWNANLGLASPGSLSNQRARKAKPNENYQRSYLCFFRH